VIVTLGSAGAGHISKHGMPLLMPGLEARTVDTTVAGDTLVGVPWRPAA
jgi:sugar/nucleoside kinase (ribokinase family)